MNDYEHVDVGGVRLAYRVWGEPDAPPMVLLHGIGGGGPGDWDTVAAQLADRWRVYAVDQRGHGHGDRTSGYAIDLLVADVAGLLDALGLKRVVLIGHSLGGVVAYLFAARHPERVDALVVEDAGLMYPRTPVPPQRPEGELSFDWDAVLALRSQIDEPDPRWRDEARGITVPTLLISGGPASYVRQETIAELAQALPHGELSVIDAGHMVHQERPAEFVAAVRGFLTSRT
ncbi:alpha/beta fold hydrolase [Catellatospora paridis]|uniref:alpha/beta fold hydrolase n=1 Tax=Catellatospora paridis TaxID=1617086 RepID=UPI0012D47B00|nr:alpha/beta hydrolase [Catellatospora paridis]